MCVWTRVALLLELRKLRLQELQSRLQHKVGGVVLQSVACCMYVCMDQSCPAVGATQAAAAGAAEPAAA